MELRAADAGEWAAIAAVHHDAATEAYAGIFEPYADLFADEPLSFAEELRQQWQRLLADPAVVTHVGYRIGLGVRQPLGVGGKRSGPPLLRTTRLAPRPRPNDRQPAHTHP